MAVERYAVVVNGVVTNVILLDLDANPGFEVEGALVVCGDAYVGPGFSYDGKAFVDTRTAPAEPPLDDIKRNALVAIDVQYRQLQTSLFVDHTILEELRISALAIVQAIRDAKTAVDVTTVYNDGLQKLQSLVEPG